MKRLDFQIFKQRRREDDWSTSSDDDEPKKDKPKRKSQQRRREDDWSTSSDDDEPKKDEPKRKSQLSDAENGSESSDAENGSQSSDSSDDHLIDICGDIDLYTAARYGNLDDFLRILDRVLVVEQARAGHVMRRLTPAGNSFLHVAATHGSEDIVKYIASEAPSLLLEKNADGDTVLHVAVKVGDESMVKTLVSLNMIKPDTQDEDNLLRAKNERGNMALHEALINRRESIAGNMALHEALIKRRESIALLLIQEDREAAVHELNNEGESAFYLAVRAGTVDCIRVLGVLLREREHKAKQFKSKSPIEAAIEAKNKDVMEVMFDTYPSLLQLTDQEGKTPLHYAASLGQVEVIPYLLWKYPPNASKRARSTGYFPIHLASLYGYVDIIDVLLKDCPYPEELLDKKGRNILHIATKNGRHRVVSYILKNPALEGLINMKDKKGNTPLHLASIRMHPKIVSDLTSDERVGVNLVNNKGMTALDAAENKLGNTSNLSQLLTWATLKTAGTPRLGKFSAKKHWSKVYREENYITKVNTLLLVSTLVVTVTFAAGFTVPGGYNSSGGDSGIATMLRDKGFHIFVFCDTIALYCSIIVTVTLFWAHLGDLNLALNVLTLAVPLLGIALGMMCMAFMAGGFVTVSKLRWLSAAVLLMGMACIVLLIFLILPFCLTLTSSRRMLRLLILASHDRLV